jgi:MarR family transcriptional regulator for hemolysin
MRTRHLNDGFGSLVAQLGRQWRRAVDRRLQPFGLTEATWLPLVHIARAPAPMRQKDLAAALVLDGSSVVRLLDALATAGMIERREDSTDRRARSIVLTARGLAIMDQVEAVSRDVREAALTGLSGDDLEAAAKVLERVRRNLEKIQEDEP